MKRIPISKKAISFTRRNSWTEKYSGEVIMRAGAIVFHNSISEIEEFYPVATCFSFKPGVVCDGPIYALRAKKDIVVSLYDDDEVRLDLGEHRNDVEIYYAGHRATEREYDEFGRVLRFGGAKKVLHMEPEFQNIGEPELDFVSRAW